jgi:hypothetical protein
MQTNKHEVVGEHRGDIPFASSPRDLREQELYGVIDPVETASEFMITA